MTKAQHAPYALMGDLILAYGKTTKTACGKRRPTSQLVTRDQTDCTECQVQIIKDRQFADRCRELALELGWRPNDDNTK